MPSFYKDRIQYDEPKTLEDAIWKAMYMYEQNKGKSDFRKSWKDKKQDQQNQRKKGFKPLPFRENTSQHRPGTANEHKTPELDGRKRGQPIECWSCGGAHIQRFCPHQDKNARTAYNIQEEEETVENATRGMPRIYAALDQR